jgi:hypothetical protein
VLRQSVRIQIDDDGYRAAIVIAKLIAVSQIRSARGVVCEVALVFFESQKEHAIQRCTFKRQRECQIRWKEIVLIRPTMVMNGIHNTSMLFISGCIETRQRVRSGHCLFLRANVLGGNSNGHPRVSRRLLLLSQDATFFGRCAEQVEQRA